MKICKYCNKEVNNWFRYVHTECRLTHEKNIKLENDKKNKDNLKTIQSKENAIIRIKKTIVDFSQTGGDRQTVGNSLNEISKNNNISTHTLKSIVLAGANDSVTLLLADEKLTVTVGEKYLMDILNEFSFTLTELENDGVYGQIQLLLLFNDLAKGITHKTFDNIYHPFNLMKSEDLVLLLDNVNYYKDKKRIQYQGGSAGMSVRVLKGLYARVGSYRGERVETLETELEGCGILGLTTKHIYFNSNTVSIRIKICKITSIAESNNRIAIFRDNASATREIFETNSVFVLNKMLKILSQQN